MNSEKNGGNQNSEVSSGSSSNKNQPTIHSQLPILQESDLITDESIQNQMNNIEILVGCLETLANLAKCQVTYATHEQR